MRFTLKNETARSSETSVAYHNIRWRHNTEDSDLFIGAAQYDRLIFNG
jgi:hypothetical protein